MSAISDFATRVQNSFSTLATAIDGLTADVAQLKATIEQLQNSPGTITPADQALLDQISAQVDSVAAKAAALDAQTEQVPTPQP